RASMPFAASNASFGWIFSLWATADGNPTRKSATNRKFLAGPPTSMDFFAASNREAGKVISFLSRSKIYSKVFADAVRLSDVKTVMSLILMDCVIFLSYFRTLAGREFFGKYPILVLQ